MPIPGVYRASFGRVEFHPYLISLHDEFGPGFVPHQIPHRNGARQEEMGGPPHRTHMSLNFAGLQWRTQFEDILGPMLARPRDFLMHPVWGRMRMVLKAPLSGDMDLVKNGPLYSVSLSFEQDTLTENLTIQKGPAVLSQEVKEHTASADAAAAAWKDSIFEKFKLGPQALIIRQKALTAQAAVSSFTGAADSYAAAALSQFSTGVWDPALDNQMRSLAALAQVAEVQVRSVAPTNVNAADIQANIELAAKAAVDLAGAIQANLPPPMRWYVREKVSLAAFVARVYLGKSRDERATIADHIQRINRLARVDVIDTGAWIVVPKP